MTRRPRSDVVWRRFMAGESFAEIAATEWCDRNDGCAPLPGIVPHKHMRDVPLDKDEVEDAARRHLNRKPKRRRR